MNRRKIDIPEVILGSDQSTKNIVRDSLINDCFSRNEIGIILAMLYIFFLTVCNNEQLKIFQLDCQVCY